MTESPQKPRVIIIDDDPLVQRLSRMIFEQGGFNVVVANDGGEGIRLALLNPPNVIILDIMMQGLHGFEVCKMLRAHSSLRHTAIIFTSAKSYRPDIGKAKELGADAYVVKPFSSKDLLSVAITSMNKRASIP